MFYLNFSQFFIWFLHTFYLNTHYRFSVSKVEENTLNVLKKRKLDESEEFVPKKKKRKGGPNPLSCKKKKKTSIVSINNEVMEQPTKRKRKKVKVPKHIKVLLDQKSSSNDT